MFQSTIVIGEDEKLIAKDRQKTLQDLGYRVPATISSAAEVIPIIDSKPPDLLIMDIKPDGDQNGIELASHIRE